MQDASQLFQTAHTHIYWESLVAHLAISSMGANCV